MATREHAALQLSLTAAARKLKMMDAIPRHFRNAGKGTNMKLNWKHALDNVARRTLFAGAPAAFARSRSDRIGRTAAPPRLRRAAVCPGPKPNIRG